MPKDNIHYGGWEHRDVHNINGMLFVRTAFFIFNVCLHLVQPNITSQALVARGAIKKRPFVLTRSFFAGSQRFGAMWTGDNLGTWEHMAVGVQMVLANGIAGMSFGGGEYAHPRRHFTRLMPGSQPMLEDSLATLRPRCSSDGIKLALLLRFSAPMPISTPSAENPFCSTSLTKEWSAIFCVCDTLCCLFGIPLSGKRL